MGNCLIREKSMVWAGDDWESLAPKNIHRQAKMLYDEEEETDNDDIERERLLLLGEDQCSKSRGTTTSTREVVKIKMTKKQLEELVGRSVDMKAAGGLSSVEQVLGQLVMMKKTDDGVDDDYYEMRRDQQSSWRPVLQSIPEVN